MQEWVRLESLKLLKKVKTRVESAQTFNDSKSKYKNVGWITQVPLALGNGMLTAVYFDGTLLLGSWLF